MKLDGVYGMGCKKLSIILLAAVFCGCESQKAPEPQGPVVQKNKKESQANRMRIDNTETP